MSDFDDDFAAMARTLREQEEQSRDDLLDRLRQRAKETLTDIQLHDLMNLIAAADGRSITQGAIKYLESRQGTFNEYAVIGRHEIDDAAYKIGRIDKRTREGKEKANRLKAFANAGSTIFRHKNR